MLDLDYREDSSAQVDMNIVMAEGGTFIEVQGTAERFPFTPEQLQEMLDLGRKGCADLVAAQRSALGALSAAAREPCFVRSRKATNSARRFRTSRIF